MRHPADPDQPGSGTHKAKPVVIRSIEDDTGLLCVDIVEHVGHGFGFQEFRRDPEDPFGWRATGLAHVCTLGSADLAFLKATEAIDWLT